MNCIVNTKVKSEIQVRVIGSSRQLLKPIWLLCKIKDHIQDTYKLGREV
jgi:hypothetical protein